MSAYRSGVPVWLSGNTVHFRDEATDPSKPWRKAVDARSYAETVSGLDESTPVVPDAFGDSRMAHHFALGPLNVQGPGLMLIVK